MAGKLFTGITSGITQGLTKGLFHKQEEPEDHGFQDLLSHLQPKQQTINLHSNLNDNNNKLQAQSQETKPISSLKVDEEDLFANQEESGWGIGDDDLIIDQIDQINEEVKAPEVEHKEKEVEHENKSKTPERKTYTPTAQSEKNTKALFDSMNEKNQGNGSSKRKISLPFKQMRDKASDLTKNMAGSLMGKITKGEGNTDEKAKKGGESASDKAKVHEPFDFKDVFSRLVETSGEHPPKKGETEMKREGNAVQYEDGDKLKRQMQKYMAQANQLEVLVREERELIYEEHSKKLQEVEELRQEAMVRLEECEKKEKELRTLNEKVKLKENLNIDENYLEEVAREKNENQEKIADLETKNQFLELTMKTEQDKFQKEIDEKIGAIQKENLQLLLQRETQLKKEYEELIREKTNYYENELSKEKSKYKSLAKKAKGFASSFKTFKESLRASLLNIEETLWAKGEEYGNTTQIIKEFQEKMNQMNYGFKVKLDQKEQWAKKHSEIEKGLKEEIEELETEKTRIIAAKDKEIKDLKNKLNRLEEGFEIEKGNLLMIQTKLDEVSMKLQNSEQKAKALEKEKNEFKKNLDSEKKVSTNLQIKVDDLLKREKEHEESIKALEKAKLESKKTLDEEKKKFNALQLKYDEELAKEKERTQLLSELEKKQEELETFLDNEKSKSLALEITLDEVNRNGGLGDSRISALEKEKNEIEEKYINELKELKARNYKTEENYLKEIEDLKKEIEKARSLTPTKESKSIWRKSSSNSENQKKIHELTEQIEHLNTEKITLAERYKKDKNELIASYNERFNSLNIYIEQLYAKNHELTEDKKKIVSKLSLLKEKLSILDHNFKDLASHHEAHSHKEDIRELLSQLNFLQGSESPQENVQKTPEQKESPVQKKEEVIEEKETPKKFEEIFSTDENIKEISSLQAIEKNLSTSSEEIKKSSPATLQVETGILKEIINEEESEDQNKEIKEETLAAEKFPTIKETEPTPKETEELEQLPKTPQKSASQSPEKKESKKFTIKSPFMTGLSSLGKIVSAIPLGLKGHSHEAVKAKDLSKSAGLPENLNESPSLGIKKDNNVEMKKSKDETKESPKLKENEDLYAEKVGESPLKSKDEFISQIEKEIGGGWNVDNFDMENITSNQPSENVRLEKEENTTLFDNTEEKRSPTIISEVKISLLSSPTKLQEEQNKIDERKREMERESETYQEKAWDLDVDIQPEVLDASPKENVKEQPENINNEDIDLEPKDDGWGLDVQLEDTQKPVLISSPLKTTDLKSSFEKKNSPLKKQEEKEENVLTYAQIDTSSPWDLDLNIDLQQGTQPTHKSPEKPQSNTNWGLEVRPGTVSFGVTPGLEKEGTDWNVEDDLDLNLVATENKSPKLQESKGILGTEGNKLKKSEEITTPQSSNKKLNVNDSKTSLESPLKKSVEKSSATTSFDFSAKSQTLGKTEQAKTGTEEKEKKKAGGLVINKILLPKKGAATSNKLNLGKAKEEKDDIDLEEFLGSSIK